MSIVKPKVFWPVVIGGTNQALPYKYSGVDHSVNVAAATYTSAVGLAAAIQTAIIAQGILTNMVVTVDSTGHFVFTDTIDGAFILRWSLITNSIYIVLGFTAVDTASATVQTAPRQHTNGWYSPTAPRRDSLPIRARANDTVTVALSGQSKFVTESELTQRIVFLMYLPPEKTYIVYETGNLTNQAIENWWASGRGRFRYWPDGTDEATFFDYVLDQTVIEKFAPDRMFDHKALYQMEMPMRGYVA